MSTAVVTVPVTVTASQSVIVVTSTLAASDLPNVTGVPTSSPTTPASASSSAGGVDASPSDASSSAPASSSSANPTSSGSHTPIGAIAGGAVGGVALIAFIVVLACFMRRRSKAKKTPSPFPDDEDEKGPSVIAGLPPNPSTTQLRPVSGSYNHSMVMTDAGSSMPLLATEGSLHSGSHGPGGPFPADARSPHMQRPSTTSLAPSFVMGSSASYPHSHSSHLAQPWNGPVSNAHDPSAAAFAGGYPDVHRTAFYEPYMPTGVDPRVLPTSAIAAGSAAAAYHNGGMMNSTASPPALAMDPRARAAVPGVSSLPVGAAATDYASLSDAARLGNASQTGFMGTESARSGAASTSDASSRRGSHGSMLAMLPAVTQLVEPSSHVPADAGSPHRRPPAAGFPGYQSNLNTIPGSVAVSEIASADHQSMHSAGQSHRGEASIPPKLPSIPASSPLVLQDATSFVSPEAAMANAPHASALGASGPRITAEPGTDTLRSNDASYGTYNSDGTYNTYTGAIKGQLRVVGSNDSPIGADAARGASTIIEEESATRQPKRDMSGDSRAGEFWIDAADKSKFGPAGNRLGQHSSNNSTSSVNKTGSRMIEMLDVDEQPNVPESVTGPAEPSTQAPARPSFWKERTKSSQSISKVFRSSPLLHANGSPVERSPAPNHGGRPSGLGTDPARANGMRTDNEHLPPLDLGRSIASSDNRPSDSPKADGDADMWKDASKQKQGGAMRKWTRKKAGRSASGGQNAENEVDVDQLFK